MGNRGIGFLVGGGVIGLFALITFFSSFGEVPAGDTGVVTSFSAVQFGEAKHEGLYSIIPFVQKVHLVDTKPHKISLDNEEAVTADRQEVKTSIALTVQVDPAQAEKTYQQYRDTVVDQVVMPKFQEAVKTVTAKYDAKTQVVQRGMVQSEMLTYVQHELQGKGVIIGPGALSIINFAYNDDYQKAIEDTQVAQQHLLQSKAELQVSLIEAQKKIAEANGESQSQKLLAKTITPESLQYQFLKTWNGHLPTVMSSGQNIMDISSLLGKK